MIFLIDWQWIWFKNYFEDIKSRKSSNENPQNVVIFELVFGIYIVFNINQKASVLSKYRKNIYTFWL